MARYSSTTLQEHGVRVTPQRALIWQALAESGEHFTAEELWERVKGGLPGVELSTVYRALEALEGAGLVAESRLPQGPRVFEAQPSTHPHLVCEACGRIFHPEPEVGQGLTEALNVGLGGFEVRRLYVVVEGQCAECAGKAAYHVGD